MNTPFLLQLAFVIITITVSIVFYIASKKSKRALIIILVIMLVQGLLAFFNFYSAQPLQLFKVPMIMAPSFLLIIYTLVSKPGKKFIKMLDLRTLTILHTIRIPVELVLLMLFTYKAIPEVMTFEGRNFDILAGLTAPLIYFLAFKKDILGPKGLLIWNILSLGLLINIIVHALFSLELPIQQFGLDQPNRAILYFPYVWLPTVVVPIVFFSHCAAIQRLLKMKLQDEA